MSILRKFKKKLLHYAWDLAFFECNLDFIEHGIDFSKIHIIKNPYKNKWFADPFILRVTEQNLILLVEEFDYSVNRGRIAQIVIDKVKNEIVSCDIILELPTHLSFPAIYRSGGKILVHPENSASGASYIYEYDESLKKLVNPIEVLNEPITDAIIISDNEGYKMYATRVPEPNGCNLRVYSSRNITGPYTAERIEVFPHCRARMAGNFIEKNGEFIRPAQDCEGSYGKAVIFYSGCNVIGEIRPPAYKYAGVHTFNILDNTCIIDIKIWDYPTVALIKNMIKKWICVK